MSLVDYASSSDEEEKEEAKVPEQSRDTVEDDKRRCLDSSICQSPSPVLNPPLPRTQFHSQRSGSKVNKQGEKDSEQLDPSMPRLPDASLLLNSPALLSHPANATDHSSRVAAAMAESESRKRELRGLSSSNFTRNKVPRGNLPHSKRVPDTVGGHLLPPQLTGRSNIVTEDVNKLFVKRHVDSSSQ
ncbi:hypothetical protein ACH5RR_000968 [Cinchona calisaya]|uniref:Uncharacterized protein n=1 Tax=Cinchona calisaya TaxID=153742 RepID=A0ABD3B230_9GENT